MSTVIGRSRVGWSGGWTRLIHIAETGITAFALGFLLVPGTIVIEWIEDRVEGGLSTLTTVAIFVLLQISIGLLAGALAPGRRWLALCSSWPTVYAGLLILPVSWDDLPDDASIPIGLIATIVLASSSICLLTHLAGHLGRRMRR